VLTQKIPIKTVTIKTVDKDVLQPFITRLRLGDERAIIDIIRIYTFGIHGVVNPDTITSSKLCMYVINHEAFSKSAKVKCKEFLRELHYEASVIPSVLPENIIEIIENNLPADFTIHETAVDIFENTPNEPIIVLDDIDIFMQHRIMDQIEANRQVLLHGPQNVHSTSVQNVANEILKTHEGISGHNTNEDSHIENEINQLLTDKNEKENAIRVFNSLEKNSIHGRYDKTEKDVFNVIYNSVKDNKDAKTILYKSLASGIENNNIVCSTGKIVRIIGSLDGLDINNNLNLPQLKTESIIDQEISNLAVKIKNNILSKQPDDIKNKYETEGDEYIENIMKTQFHNELKETYAGILSSQVIDDKYEYFAAGF
jgi:hypothetical protein